MRAMRCVNLGQKPFCLVSSFCLKEWKVRQLLGGQQVLECADVRVEAVDM